MYAILMIMYHYYLLQLKMKFAPLLIPWKRRMETFAILQWMLCATMMGLVSILLLVYILYSSMLRPIG